MVHDVRLQDFTTSVFRFMVLGLGAKDIGHTVA